MKTKITIVLAIKGGDPDAIEGVIDELLDSGAIQDVVNDALADSDDASEASVTSAECFGSEESCE